MSHPLGISAAVATGFISSALSWIAFRAWRRSDDRRMLYLIGAFAAFAIKGFLPFVAHQTNWPGHNVLEIAQSLLDLTIILLLVAPFLHRA